jgi:ATP phosphoribosyltransferase
VTVRLGLPKGSLQQPTFELFSHAGYSISVGPRSYYPVVDDGELECRLLRPQEIPRYVADGVLDAGISGHDWILENRADVVEVAELVYAKQSAAPVRWVVAVGAESSIRSVADLNGKRIATELVNVTKDFLAERGIEAAVEYSYGATEAKVPELVDAIVELTETGSSLRAQGLRIVDTVIESTTRLVASRAAWSDEGKKEKLQGLAVLLLGALRARKKVGLKMNVPRDRLAAVLDILPAMKQPTVSPLRDEAWCAVEAVLDQSAARILLPQLKRAGAQDIIEYPLNKVVP